MQVPSIGRVVHYKLTAGDVATIQQRRDQLRAAGLTWSAISNPVPGEVFPAEIVRVWGAGDNAVVNLQVKLDGPDTLWVTSVGRSGDDHHAERTYIWPPRV